MADPVYSPPLPTYQYRKPVKGSVIWWLRFLGVAAFLAVLAFTLPASKEVQLARVDLRWLGLCMLLTILQLLLDATQWHQLLRMQGVRHAYPKTIIAYLASLYLGMVTPWHVGSFLAAGYISMETGITFGYALSSVVMKKLLTWIITIGFGIWGLPLLAEVTYLHGVKRMAWVSAVIFVVMCAGIGLWIFSLRRLTKKWQRLSPWQIDMTEFWAGMKAYTTSWLALPLVTGLVSFLLLFVQFHAVLKSMAIALPFALVARITSFSRIAARFMPVSVAGFGAKDAAIIVLLSQQRIEWPVALTAVLLWLLCSYVVTLLLAGLCWWIKPLVIQRAAPATR
jgi:uncharacterized protein (TIRG00374 family)